MALVKSKSNLRKPTTEELQAARGIPSDTRLALLNALVSPDNPLRCVHCGDVADDPVASHCTHILCKCAPCLLSFLPLVGVSCSVRPGTVLAAV